MKASSRPPSANDLAQAAVADAFAKAKGAASASAAAGEEMRHPAKQVAHPPSLPATSGAPSSARGGGAGIGGISPSPSGMDATDDDADNGDGKKKQNQRQHPHFPPPPLPSSSQPQQQQQLPAVPVNAHRQPRLPPAERAARMKELYKAREALCSLPMCEVFEIPGRPGLMYELRDYSKPWGKLDRKEGIRCARQDLPFLFRAFEAGQAPPPRPGTKRATEARAATIHEYLDWTISAEEATPEEKSAAEARRVREAIEEAEREKKAKAAADAAAAGGAAASAAALGAAGAAAGTPPGAASNNSKQSTPAAAATTTTTTTATTPSLNLNFYSDADADADFSGFRTVVLLPRFRPGWPPPGAYDSDGVAPSVPALGGPRPPIPTLLPHGKPICAATVRSSLGYLEVPFFATQESRRNRGYGRALLECCETVARALNLPALLLCSTDDKITRATWTALGFSRSTEEQLRDEFGVKPGDLLHMDNTVQMHKKVPPRRDIRSVVLKHGSLVQRLYFEPFKGGGGGGVKGDQGVAVVGSKRPLLFPSEDSSPVKREGAAGDGDGADVAAPGSSNKRARVEENGKGSGSGCGLGGGGGVSALPSSTTPSGGGVAAAGGTGPLTAPPH